MSLGHIRPLPFHFLQWGCTPFEMTWLTKYHPREQKRLFFRRCNTVLYYCTTIQPEDPKGVDGVCVVDDGGGRNFLSWFSIIIRPFWVNGNQIRLITPG